MTNEKNMLNPYEQFAQHELILRDQLAIDRTNLANERTMLAYARTGLTLVITGAGCIKFWPGNSGLAVGVLLLIAGAAVAVIGFVRYIAMKKIIRTAGSQTSISGGPR